MKKLLAAFSVLLVAGALALTISRHAHAGYPERPIRIVVPFGPGGFTDVAARILQKELGAALGQPVIVENKAGAGSTIGTNEIAKGKPDGYTLVMVSTTHVISPHLYKQMPYDALKDFTPIMKIAEGPYVLVVHPSFAAKSVADLIAMAKKDPGKIDYASSGNGSSQHLVGALFTRMAGIDLNHVPYRGSNQAMSDVLGGQVKVSFVGVPNALPNIASGRLRALGVSTMKRYPELPDVPTIAEAGVPGYDATIWLGLLAPPGTPREIVQKLNAEVGRVLATPDARRLMASAGVEVATSTPEEFGRLMQREFDRWGKVVRETGATVN